MPRNYAGCRPTSGFGCNLRLLVADDTVLTIEELKKLRNERFHRPEFPGNLIGRDLGVVLQPVRRSFLSSAEAVFRPRRDDPRFDLSGPAIEYAKAVETELNALVFPALRKVLRMRQPVEREVSVDGRRLDLGGTVPHQTLGTLKNLLQHNGLVRGQFQAVLGHAD